MGNDTEPKGNGIIQKVVIGVLIVGVIVFAISFFVKPANPDDGGDEPVPTNVEKPDGKEPTDGTGNDGTGKPKTQDDGTLLGLYSDDEGVAKLVADMEDGDVPKSCDLLYDQMGANPSLTITDPKIVREVYELVQGIEVSPDAEAMSVTDSYHHVYFTLQDGTRVGWSFEGMGCVRRGKDVIPVVGDGNLWAYAIKLYKQGYKETDGGDAGGDQTHDTGQLSDGSYAIVLDDEEEVVKSCPRSAKPSETVTVTIADMTDVYPVVTVDGGDISPKQRGMSYLFEMPDHAVTVEVHTSSYGIGGA